ncbi:hypothetical protein Hanom_Chr16g01520351 [Helianthus anomalus]
MVFETEAGIGLMYFQMKDLEPSVYIDAAIVTISLRRRQRSKCRYTFGYLVGALCI